MMGNELTANRRPPTHRIGVLLVAGLGLLLASAGGCSSFLNPSFIALITEPTVNQTGTVSQGTLTNAPGHVPVFFINNTTFDQTLINYMSDLGIDTSDANLRPRVRLRVQIDYVNGSSNTIEFLDGSSIVQGSVLTSEGAQENPLIPRDLTENTLTNVVAVCDIAAIRPDVSVEVFVPVFLKVSGFEGDLVFIRSLNETIPPQFTVLQPDQVDANFNVTLQRNFDIRDVPVPVTNVQCGSVTAFVLSGTLRVPFVQDELGQLAPGWRDADTAAQASNPGRFTFATAVR
jgi:hypothetical protein